MTWGDSHYGTYAFGQRWSDWDGRDDWEPDEDLLDHAEDHRNESRTP